MHPTDDPSRLHWRDANESARNARTEADEGSREHVDDLSLDSNSDDLFSMDGIEPDAFEADSEAVPSDLHDAFFDNDLPPAQAELLYGHLNRRRDLAAEFLGTQRAIEALRLPQECPDLSSRILGAVDRRRGLWSGAGMARLLIGRVAIAASVLLAAAGVFALHASSSELATAGQPTPIGKLASAVPGDISPGRARMVATSDLPQAGSTLLSRTAERSASREPGPSLVVDLRTATLESFAALAARNAAAAADETFTRPNDGNGRECVSAAFIASNRQTSSIELAAQFSTTVARPTIRWGDRGGDRAPGSIATIGQSSRELTIAADLGGVHDRVIRAGIDQLAVVAATAPSRRHRAALSTHYPVITEDCVYFMGRAIDRDAFDLLWSGFTTTPLATMIN